MNHLLMASFSAMFAASTCLVALRHVTEWRNRRDSDK